MKGIDFNTNIPSKDIDRELVSKKLDNLKDMQYLTNAEIANNILLEWQKNHSTNDKLETLINAIVQIHFYVTELQNDRHLLMLSIDEYRTDKLRAIERARKAESKLESKKD
jgi:hypothetical protein|tara:strand:+ start:93 stop:425 length:333 start_codon:yes stop_codon:yes gene_type:complete